MAAGASFYLDGGMMACGNTERSPAGIELAIGLFPMSSFRAILPSSLNARLVARTAEHSSRAFRFCQSEL